MVWQRFAKSPRSSLAGSTPVASAKILRSGRAGKARVSETRYVGSNPTSVANYAGVAQLE
jgi:hypothetical protein